MSSFRESFTPVPFQTFLGLRFEWAGDEVTAVLPYADHLIGNPLLPALHGGVIGALLEATAMAQLAHSEPRARQPKPIDVNVQYLRSGRPQTTFARAQIKRAGRRIATVFAEAWQDQRAAPIASLQAHFLLAESDLVL